MLLRVRSRPNKPHMKTDRSGKDVLLRSVFMCGDSENDFPNKVPAEKTLDPFPVLFLSKAPHQFGDHRLLRHIPHRDPSAGKDALACLIHAEITSFISTLAPDKNRHPCLRKPLYLRCEIFSQERNSAQAETFYVNTFVASIM